MRIRSLRSLSVKLVAVAAMSLAFAPLALAHGEAKPRFGGIVKAAQEISFELVADAKGGAEVYMDDHGNLMPTTGVSGKLAVIGKSGDKKETPLTSDGKKLVASGASPASGDRVILVVVLPSQQTISVRYAIP